MKNGLFATIFIVVLLHTHVCAIRLSSSDARLIGEKIWHNEGAKQVEKLTWWNGGENFASLGIGHFIWYPKGVKKIFSESFPDLIRFIESQGVPLPALLRKNKKLECPWVTREEFFKDFDSKGMNELRIFLAKTIDLQTKFIIQRIQRMLPGVVKSIPMYQSTHVKKQFQRVAKSNAGLYALIDYVNFKGEGTNQKETYNGHGWGLLHVLLEMHGEKQGQEALNEFAEQALMVLTRRVDNAPEGKDEARWLPGWKNRIETYKKSFYSF